jgi:uncharacterized protein with PIN domain
MMSEGKSDNLCQDCDATFAAFLEEMAEHNAEQVAELNGQVVCPTCGKIHPYTPAGDSNKSRRPAN